MGPSTSPWQADPAIVRLQRRTLRVLVSAQILGGVGIGTGAALGALLAEAVTGTEALAGLARTASTLGAAIAAIPLAYLASRQGRGIALGTGWALSAIGAVSLVVAAILGNVPILVIGMLLFGTGMAANLQSRYAATDTALPLKRASTLSLVVWSTTIGAVLGPNLSGPGRSVARALNVPPLSGAFVIAATTLGVASIITFTFMRPDPLRLARTYDSHAMESAGTKPRKRVNRAALRVAMTSPMPRFGLLAVVLGNTVMAAVMTMTPVHMYHHGASLELVGFTISVHVLGMYAFSPVVGRLSDRWGRVRVVVLGQGLFIGAFLCGALGSTSPVIVTVGLFVLGLGWSCTLIAGSTILVESVPEEARTSVQGTSDMLMNVSAAFAAGISGPVQGAWGFEGLNAWASLLIAPVLISLIRAKRVETVKSCSS